MSEASVMTDELRKQIGVEGEPLVVEMEKGMLRKFVDAIGDPNPLWSDEEHAKKSKYGGIIAPPTFVLTIGSEQFQEVLALISAGTVLLGGTELEFYQPVRPGDWITVITKIRNARERQGRMGKMVFVSIETTYQSRRQELVARCQQMLISY